jgi:FlaA1/EpsC-like NDP-sugar epimerase
MPTRKRRWATLLVVYDLVALAASGFGAVLIETNLFVRGNGWNGQDAAYFTGVFVIGSMLGLFGAKIHQRLWVRATVRDFLSVAFWLVVASVVTFAIVSFGKAAIEWSVLRATLIAGVAGCTLVCLPRLALDTVREIALMHRVSGPGRAGDANAGGNEPVVVVGAGDLGTLFLDHLKASSRDAYQGMRILGFIDKNEALHGRMLRSFRVLGGMETLRSMAEAGEVKGVVVAINSPEPELVEELETLAREHAIKMKWWKVALEGETEDGKTEDRRPLRSKTQDTRPES